MKTLILTIGNEVTSGHTVNTNAAWIASRIEEAGLTPERVLTVRDDGKTLVSEIKKAVKEYDVVIITGGLGPTHDDITKPALVKAFGAPLVRDEKILKEVEHFFKKLGVKMPPVNLGQADVPTGFTALLNRRGTAPGLYLAHQNGAHLFALPGVPGEMKSLMDHEVIPILKKKMGKEGLVRTLVRTAGAGESFLQPEVEATGVLADDGIEIAFLPSMGQVDIRITARGKNEQEAKARLTAARNKVKKAVGKWVYGKDRETLEEAIGKLLRKYGLTLASAESCTGGQFAAAITAAAGSSDYYLEGAVTYSNEAKSFRLKVPPKLIELKGAVSEEVAAAMARGICHTSGADIGLSATGIAGPGGGTKEKPVGLVYIGMSYRGEVIVREYHSRFDRATNQMRTTRYMLAWLYRTLKERK